jgi:thiamine-phosphate pyrophosphorylase
MMTVESENHFFLGGICFITDRALCPESCFKVTHAALEAGVRWIQYRDKDMNRLTLYKEALELRKVTREFGAYFIVNDHADIAAAVDADGVHLGQDDLPLVEARKILGSERLIGISTHSEDEAVSAQEDGADYIGFGPVFHTTTKDAGNPKGTDMIGDIREKVNIPIVAIGGIGIDNFAPVISSGAMAVAVASSIIKGDLAYNAKSFVRKIRQMGESDN